MLEVKTNARPVDGEANKAIIEMIAKFLGIAKSRVELVRGDKSKSKRVRISIELSAGKNKEFYASKFTSILKEST